MRHVGRLGRETGERIEAERRRAAFLHLGDFAKRAAPKRDELDALAELGALGSVDAAAGRRRSALWQVAALERDPRSLFAGASPPAADSPLEEMTPFEETLADYRVAGLTTGDHVMSHLRPELQRRGILSAEQVRAAPNGRFVRTAGHVITRQRPGSAKVWFLTLEDETGTANGVVMPNVARRFRAQILTSSIVEIAGPVQSVEGVVHVQVRDVRPLAPRGALPRGHDFR
jgi:error-prone DNA polymerase